jgi:hypothetical protein
MRRPSGLIAIGSPPLLIGLPIACLLVVSQIRTESTLLE